MTIELANKPKGDYSIIEGDDYTVTAIGAYAFAPINDIGNITQEELEYLASIINGDIDYGPTNIEVPETLLTIGDGAFMYCTNSVNIDLNICKNLLSIGVGAFTGYYSLLSITIPENVNTIGRAAFSDCKNLFELNYNAIALNDLEYGNSVFQSIGEDSTGVKVTIGMDVKRIPTYIFWPYTDAYYPNVIELNILSDNIEYIGEGAFSGLHYDHIVVLNSSYVYLNYLSGALFSTATTVRVLASIDDGSNTYLNDNFTKTTEGEYNVYTKN